MVPKIGVVAVFILSLFVLSNFSFAQGTSASQIQRSQEILEKEEALLNKIEGSEQFFIRKIIVKGASSLAKDKIREIILPFQKKWLNRGQILQIFELLKQAYSRMGKPMPEISHRIKKHILEIKIKEKN